MAFLPWKDEYSVGVELFDEQHRKMFSYINELNDALMEVEERVVMHEILDNLKEYTIVHFNDEEVNMKKYHFEEFDEHEEEHQKLTQQVVDLADEFAEDPGKSFDAVKVMDFLYHWIVDHILDTDKKYAEFFVGKEIIAD